MPGLFDASWEGCGIQTCQEPEAQKPLLAAVVLARSDSNANLHTALHSISCAVDVVMLVHRAGTETPHLEQVLSSMTCKPQLLQHNLTWSDSLSEARNAALHFADMGSSKCQPPSYPHELAFSLDHCTRLIPLFL